MFSFFWKKKKNQTTETTVDETQNEHVQESTDQKIIASKAQQAEVQQAEVQQAEVQQAEVQQAEVQQAEVQQAEVQQAEVQQAEVQQAEVQQAEVQQAEVQQAEVQQAEVQQAEVQQAEVQQAEKRGGWLSRLAEGLKKTGKSITEVFTGTQIDDALYEELEMALLMADTGTAATQYLLDDVKQRVKDTKATEPAAVRELLKEALTELLTPLESALKIGENTPTVIMVAGVNGAGKTTTIGKLTRYLAREECKVLLAAGDTFRAAAREQLAIWADRNTVEIIAQDGGDPASVSYDAVAAGKARGSDVVIIDTAGRLATQLHLMDELKKVRRVIGKAMENAPHEVLLVVDGNTGQNALTQVKAFDQAIDLTGLVVTKLDGTAKGGVIAAIALWSSEREKAGKPFLPVYFIGIGEQVEDLQTFNAREFAHALLQI